MKGILESIPGFLQIIIALVVAIILFGLAFKFSGIFKDSSEITISGEPDDVAKLIAKNIENCWSDNREGLAPESQVCKIFKIKPTELVTESDVVKHLNCQLIPDNKCESGDCSSCTSDKYDDQDKVKWDVSKKDTKLKITYFGSERVVYVEEVAEECDNKPLMTCKDRVVAAAFEPNLIVLSDLSPITECCNDATLTFLKNVARYFGGSDILIIWESESSDPSLGDKTPMIDMLTTEGFNVSYLKHTKTLNFVRLEKYDQIWIFRPGWCDKGIIACTDFESWTSKDIDVIKEYSKKGKIFLITDWDPSYSYDIPNSILSSLGFNSRFENTCGCGCENTENPEIVRDPLTAGVKSFEIKASSHLVC